MFLYYSLVQVFLCLALVVMALLTHENSRLGRSEKKRFYFTYGVIAVAMAAEWLGLALNGAPPATIGLHAFIKCIDYIFTPLAGFCLVTQVTRKSAQQKYVWRLLIANAVFQLLSLFTGWSFYLDDRNFYYHGPLYFLYILCYCVVIASVLFEFYRHGKRFKRQNRSSLFAAIALVCAGILVQELLDMRIAYLVITLCSILLFIHNSEFAQLESDDALTQHRRLLETDILTGLKSRYAYTEKLREYEAGETIPEDLIVFSVDVNELKTTNDRLGHLAGDDLICGASSCILNVLGPYGTCYRTGGDEFIAFVRPKDVSAEMLKSRLAAESHRWHGKLAPSLSLSIGYALYMEVTPPDIQKLISRADQAMYREKNLYYRQPGKDRRAR